MRKAIGNGNPVGVEVGADPSTSYGMNISMVGSQSGGVISAPVRLIEDEQQKQHVMPGHYPFDPHCLECQEEKSSQRRGVVVQWV